MSTRAVELIECRCGCLLKILPADAAKVASATRPRRTPGSLHRITSPSLRPTRRSLSLRPMGAEEVRGEPEATAVSGKLTLEPWHFRCPT